MSNDPPAQTERDPNRGFRPPSGEYTAAQRALPDDRTMTDFLRACLRWLTDEPEAAPRVLAGYWPDSPRPGRPPGARDRQPRKPRGSASSAGRWWALWNGGEMRGVLCGPLGAGPDEAMAMFAAGGDLEPDGNYRLEQCDDERAGELQDWDGKSEAEKTALRPDWAGMPAD